MYVKVKLTPDAKRESLEQGTDTSWSVSVREPAKQNLANRRLRELLARHYNTSVSRVRIVSGHHHPSKMLSINCDNE